MGQRRSRSCRRLLYTRSFQMMVRAGNLRVMQALADAANRLSEGEVVQMVNAHDPSVDETRYFRVIERKTACLFEAGARMAAAIAECSKEQEEAVGAICDWRSATLPDCR